MKHGIDCDCRTKIACEDAEEAELHGTVRGRPIADAFDKTHPVTMDERFGEILAVALAYGDAREKHPALVGRRARKLRAEIDELREFVRAADAVIDAAGHITQFKIGELRNAARRLRRTHGRPAI